MHTHVCMLLWLVNDYIVFCCTWCRSQANGLHNANVKAKDIRQGARIGEECAQRCVRCGTVHVFDTVNCPTLCLLTRGYATAV